jgi:excisionase family DNA binding protein
MATTMSINSSEGEILTIKQVADYLKVTERTIYRLAAAKKIPAFKVGGTWRFSRADIDSWIKLQSLEGLDAGREGDDVAKDQMNDGERK